MQHLCEELNFIYVLNINEKSHKPKNISPHSVFYKNLQNQMNEATLIRKKNKASEIFAAPFWFRWFRSHLGFLFVF